MRRGGEAGLLQVRYAGLVWSPVALATSLLLGVVAAFESGLWAAVAGIAVVCYGVASLVLRERPRVAGLVMAVVAVATAVAAMILQPTLVELWVSLAVATVMVIFPGWLGRGLAGLLMGATLYLVPLDVQLVIIAVSAVAAEATNRTFSEAALMTRRARELQRQAAEASIAKKEFLANISHELRTPMSGVLGIIDALLARDGDRDTRRKLKTVRSSAESALAIIEELLEFSRISGGHMTDAHAGFDIRALIKDIVERFRPAAEKKGLSLGALVAVGLPRQIHSDPRRIERVLMSLLHNAVKFTETGRVEVVVEARVGDGDTALRIVVRDSGIGISESARARIFEPFVQSDAETGRRFGGAGLGLTIAKRIVEEMEGAITLHSAPGEGSTFIVEIPVDFILGAGSSARRRPAIPGLGGGLGGTARGGVACPEELTAQLEESGARLDDSGAGLRAANGEEQPGPGQPAVLVVDDDPVNILVTSTLLRQLGLRPLSAESGEGCLEVLRQRRGAVDLIFMDCRMPGLDGYETTRLIRKLLPDHSRPRIVALTANAAKNEERRCRDAGMDDYLNKPTRLQALTIMLSRWLPEELQRGEEPPAPAVEAEAGVVAVDEPTCEDAERDGASRRVTPS
ncbi:MAG: response regulator [Myxococcales bacterium]|nr:response regulator [Myxococcales bacterium]